jgi:uncharacterized SAM-binding protein YcdF (DUF218 family)
MIRRLLAAVLLSWALGFALFVAALPGAATFATSDAIIVLTGAAGRIERGLTLLEQGAAPRLLISGVDRRVRRNELASEYGAPVLLFATRVDLGSEAVDTRSNALEAAAWLDKRGYRSVRLITTDWHMPRARFELAQATDGRVTILTDAIVSRPAFIVLFREYHKYLLIRIAALVGY